MALSSARGKLIGVIGDEDTCVGFLLGGIGELNKNREPNFMVVDKNTAVSDIEDTLKNFIRRDDIDIILINQNVAEMVFPKKILLFLPHRVSFSRCAMCWMPTLVPYLPSWRYPARTVLTTPARTPSSGWTCPCWRR